MALSDEDTLLLTGKSGNLSSEVTEIEVTESSVKPVGPITLPEYQM